MNQFKSKKLPDCPMSPFLYNSNGLNGRPFWTDCFGIEHFSGQGDKYVGEWKNDSFHGFGSLYSYGQLIQREYLKGVV